MSDFVKIKVFAHSYDAYVAKAYLESEGIEVYLYDEATAQIFNVVGGVRMMVPEKEAEKAIKLLQKGGYLDLDSSEED